MKKYHFPFLLLLWLAPFQVGAQYGFSISGKVHQGSGLLSTGILMVINVNTNQTSICEVSNGVFQISSLPSGTYYLCAMPDPSLVQEYLPTYWVNKSDVNAATKLVLDGSVTGVDIYLVVKTGTETGSAQILGRFGYYFGEQDTYTALDKNWFGALSVNTPISLSVPPCETMPVFVYNASNQVVYWTVTDTLGYFKIPNLAGGTYHVQGQRNGFTTLNEGTVEVSSGQTQTTTLYMVSQHVVTDIEESIMFHADKPPMGTPNPFKEILQLRYAPSTGVVICDALGSIYYTSDLFPLEELPTSTWPSGIYFLKSEEGIQKLVKK